jgi:hypothetical protein
MGERSAAIAIAAILQKGAAISKRRVREMARPVCERRGDCRRGIGIGMRASQAESSALAP